VIWEGERESYLFEIFFKLFKDFFDSGENVYYKSIDKNLLSNRGEWPTSLYFFFVLVGELINWKNDLIDIGCK